ncbi:MAG: MFS transporter [Lactobacillus sp.]|nr:MFS transporter [Lactobacillus sp.]
MMIKQHKAWKVLAVLCGLAAAAIGISINTSGVFYTVVSADLSILRGAFAFHMTIFSLVTAISALLIPYLINRFDFKSYLLFSIIAASVSTALMGMSSQLWQFYLLGAVRGLTTGLFSIVLITLIINKWFLEKNGLAISIALAFSGVMGAIFSPIFSEIIKMIGWRYAYFGEGLPILVLCLPAYLYRFNLVPQDEGLQPYGHQTQVNNKKVSNKLVPTISLVLLIAFAVIVSFASSMTQHFPGYAQNIGLTATLGASMLSMGMFGNIASKLVLGILSDMIGPLKATIILVTCAVTGAGLLFSKTIIVLMLGAFLWGACYGLGSVSIAVLTN